MPTARRYSAQLGTTTQATTSIFGPMVDVAAANVETTHHSGAVVPACKRCQYDPDAKVLASYLVVLPMAAVSQNQLTGRTSFTTRRMYTALRNKYERLLAPQVKNIPPAKTKRRITFTRVYRKGRRLLDSDNLVAGFKGARDVLTRLSMIIDDTAKYSEVHYLQKPGPEDAVEITLEDLQWPT